MRSHAPPLASARPGPDPAGALQLAGGFVIDARYRVIRRIGSGGVASVFESERLPLASRVAVKVVHPIWASIPEVNERFRREVAALSALDSALVVAILGAGRAETPHGDLPYLAMELVEGPTVADLIDGGPLEPGRAVQLAVQALEALGEVHDQGVVHRDVKPENLVVSEDCPAIGTSRIKLIDFGLSRAIAEAAPDRLTRIGFTVGTPSYIAPEQALADARADHRIDLFSMGVTLYEMLTGTLPFDGPSNTVVLARILGAEPRPPTELVSAIGGKVERVVLRALEKDPELRFPDAESFRGELLEAM